MPFGQLCYWQGWQASTIGSLWIFQCLSLLGCHDMMSWLCAPRVARIRSCTRMQFRHRCWLMLVLIVGQLLFGFCLSLTRVTGRPGFNSVHRANSFAISRPSRSPHNCELCNSGRASGLDLCDEPVSAGSIMSIVMQRLEFDTNGSHSRLTRQVHLGCYFDICACSTTVVVSTTIFLHTCPHNVY